MRSLRVAALLAAGLLPGTGAVAGEAEEQAPQRRVLVELFTSQG